MTSAYASPPPFRFGPAHIKGNGYRILERALVISALVHLSAAGLFRAAQERLDARNVLDLRTNEHHVDVVDIFTPPLVPPWNPTGSLPTEGVIIPVDNTVSLPTIDANPFVASPFTGTERNPGGRDEGTIKVPGPPPDVVEPTLRAADKLPVVIDAPKPAYPDWAREAGIEGKVILRVLVGTDGIPKQVVVASGSKALADAARDGVLRWKFSPGMVGKEPVEVWVEVPVTFRLSGS